MRVFKDSLNNIGRRIGFTETELRIVLFLSAVFVIGIGLKLILADKQAEYRNFDYTATDSLFNAAISGNASLSDTAGSVKTDTVNGGVFLRNDNYQPKSKNVLKNKSININTASADELTRLPGIGPKTAEKIIEYRKKFGKFKSVDELIEVKGIGEKKLEKIKQLIFTE